MKDSSTDKAGRIAGGQLFDNSDHNAWGGCVYIGNSGELVMNGGKITNNMADLGGSVFIDEGGSFTMNGGTISDNTVVSNGGGVSVSQGTFIMNGGTISNNKTLNSSVGKDICYSGNNFYVSGSPVVNDILLGSCTKRCCASRRFIFTV